MSKIWSSSSSRHSKSCLEYNGGKFTGDDEFVVVIVLPAGARDFLAINNKVKGAIRLATQSRTRYL